MSEHTHTNNRVSDSKASSSIAKNKKISKQKTITTTRDQILHLQRTIGNQAVLRLINNGAIQAKLSIGHPVDSAEVEGDKTADRVMRMTDSQINTNPKEISRQPEEELQGKLMRQEIPEDEEELLQGKFESTKKKENNTGMPDNLKSGIENISGMSIDDVKVNYNSSKPSKVGALAYTQGTDIHMGPGQEKHLPHEAWHVVQQKQGRVKPIMQMKSGVNINDDEGLEKEADVMGRKAFAATGLHVLSRQQGNETINEVGAQQDAGDKITIQRLLWDDLKSGEKNIAIAGETHNQKKFEKEKESWKQVGITLKAEYVILKYASKGNESKQVKIQPDDPLLRVVQLFQFLRRVCRVILQKDFSKRENEEKIQLRILLKEISAQVKKAMNVKYKDDKADRKKIVEIIDDWGLYNKDGQTKFVSYDDKESALNGLLSGLLKNYNFKVDPKSVEKPTSIKRSQFMLKTINDASEHMENHIYKVGQEHIEHMMDRDTVEMDPKEKVGLYSKDDYLKEHKKVDKHLKAK